MDPATVDDLRKRAMKDLAIALENRPGALADMGEALGRGGVSVEGGGVFVVNGVGVAHFLFRDGGAARKALEAAGIRVLEERDVLVQRLSQTEPGQLGKISRRMAEAGVNIEVQYSDHDHNLILVVDNVAAGRAVSEAWTKASTTQAERRTSMPPRIRLFFSALNLALFFLAAAPLYRELSQRSDIWWTPHAMLVRAQRLPLLLASAAACGVLACMFLLVLTGSLRYRGEQWTSSSGE